MNGWHCSRCDSDNCGWPLDPQADGTTHVEAEQNLCCTCIEAISMGRVIQRANINNWSSPHADPIRDMKNAVERGRDYYYKRCWCEGGHSYCGC